MTRNTPNIQVLLGFRKLTDAALLARSMAVQTGIAGNPNFPNPTVDLAALKTANDNFAAAISACLDGSKMAVAEKNKQREELIKMLRQLAIYVEANLREDISLLASSGFEAAAPKSPQQVLSSAIRSIRQGNSGQLQVRLTRTAGAASYQLRHAPLAD